jgi:hypothetical protein
MKHKVLILGNPYIYSVESSYFNNFNSLEYDCKIFDVTEINLLQKIFNHSAVYNFFKNNEFRNLISKNLNKKVIDLVNTYKPTVCFFFNLNYIFPETISSIRKKKITTITFLPDNHFHNTIFIRKEILDCLKNVDVNFCWGKEIVRKFKIKNFTFLDFAWDSLSKFKKNNIIKNQIAFIGTYDKFRDEILSNIFNKKNLKIWGNKDWKKSTLKTNYQSKELDYKKYIEYSKKNLINLNILRKQNIIGDGLNMRTFEFSGEKCFFLQNWSKAGENFFKEQSKYILFKNINELNDKINHFSEDSRSRKIILKKIFNLISSTHKYKDRIKEILKFI